MRTINPYVRPLHNIEPFIYGSYYLDPWKAYCDTWPATRLLNGIGINFKEIVPTNYGAVAQRCADAGIKFARIELGWGEFDPNNPGVPSARSDSIWRPLISALRDAAIQPLILLNLSYNVPPPQAQETVSGFLTYAVGACKYVAGILGNSFDVEIWNELTLSVPPMSRTDYSNWGQSTTGSKDMFYQWLIAPTVDAIKAAFPAVRVCNGFTNTLPYGTAASQWHGMDALSRHFYTGGTPLSIAPPGTAFAHLDALGGLEGTPNPPGQPRFVVPGSYFVPTVTVCCPEQYFLEISAPVIPITNQVQAFASKGPIPTGTNNYYIVDNNDWIRASQGLPQLPFWRGMTNIWGQTGQVWETETNFRVIEFCAGIASKQSIPLTDPRIVALGATLQSKGALRLLMFHIHKGVERVYLYSVNDGNDLGYTVIQSNGHGAIDAISNLCNLFSFYAESLPVPAPISVGSITDHSPILVFNGDGTSRHPDHFQSDDFCVMPFQASDTVYLVGFYVLTWNAFAANPGGDPLSSSTYLLPDKLYTISMSGFSGQVASVYCYDPLVGTETPINEWEYSAGSLKVNVATSDYPRILVIKT